MYECIPMKIGKSYSNELINKKHQNNRYILFSMPPLKNSDLAHKPLSNQPVHQVVFHAQCALQDQGEQSKASRRLQRQSGRMRSRKRLLRVQRYH
jgi:hypothetical protein